jgi:hypothetical protein
MLVLPALSDEAGVRNTWPEAMKGRTVSKHKNRVTLLDPEGAYIRSISKAEAQRLLDFGYAWQNIRLSRRLHIQLKNVYPRNGEIRSAAISALPKH